MLPWKVNSKQTLGPGARPSARCARAPVSPRELPPPRSRLGFFSVTTLLTIYQLISPDHFFPALRRRLSGRHFHRLLPHWAEPSALSLSRPLVGLVLETGPDKARGPWSSGPRRERASAAVCRFWTAEHILPQLSSTPRKLGSFCPEHPE